MDNWIGIFVVVASIAIVFQAIMLGAMFFELRRAMAKLEQLTTDMQTRVGPILTRVQILLDETQPKITEMIADAAHVVYLARGQAQKVDRVITDAADRLRGQLIRADRILTGTLETVEDAGTQFKRGLLRPVQKVSALVTGIKVGLDFLRSRRGNSADPDGPLEQEEELFI
jgi:hypothetical protein